MNVVFRRICDPSAGSTAARLTTIVLFQQPLRFKTNIVERVHEAPLRKPGHPPMLRRKHRVYNTVQNNQDVAEFMDVLLAKYVDDVGQPGEIVNLKATQARLLLLKHMAVYPTPENIAALGSKEMLSSEAFSSRYVKTTMQSLSKFVLNISMNKEQNWTLERWHIRAAFRRANVIVPETAIEMPDHVITGPDMKLEGKEFFITVTINQKEKSLVRCRLHHYSTNPDERLPPVRDHWKFPAELLFPEDKNIAEKLPEITTPQLEDDPKFDLRKVRKFPKKITDILR